jgi:RNA polymerase-binding transcription factor DksA
MTLIHHKMNDKVKSVFLELVNKKLTRYINNLSNLEKIKNNVISSKSDHNRSVKLNFDTKKLDVEIININKEITKLKNIEEKLHNEKFGFCVECGNLISIQRLILNPSTETCQNCNL